MYKIIGADGKEYGPVAVEQLRQWMAEGRVNNQTRVLADGSTDWKQLGDFPELSNPPLGAPVAAAPVAPKTNGMAVASLILGILSLLQCCPLLFGVLGVIFSRIAVSQINKRPGELAGKGMAAAGMGMSIAGLVINVVLLIIYWAAIMATFAARH